MSLVHIKQLIPRAQKGKYAIGAFNTSNLEVTLGIIRGATAARAPVIVQVSETAIKYAGLKAITHIVQTIAKNEAVKIPVALHLDHGKSFHSVAECIQAGFSSVHIDASELPFDENIALTRQAVKYAHKRGVWVQAELGSILGKEGLIKFKKGLLKLEDCMTNPEQVPEFIRKTGVDTLAISVGAMHGYFRGLEKIDFKRLKAIHQKTKISLVLHGASGISDQEIKKAIKFGITIINIDTELRIAFTKALKKTLQRKTDMIDPRKILTPSIDAVQKTVEKKIKVFGSAGKA